MKVLLINPSFTKRFYGRLLLKHVVFRKPVLSIATLASVLIRSGHEVKILDLDAPGADDNHLNQLVKEWQPEIAGITGTTPLYDEMIRLCRIIKGISPHIRIVVGGHHATVLPEDFLKEKSIDMVVMGEGEFSLLDIVSGKNLADIKGICYKNNNTIEKNPPREFIDNLDNLPFPAWEIYDLKNFKAPRIAAKASPCGPIETSRGCIYNCLYCSKAVFGRKFRAKSPQRVVDEIEYMLKAGFKEIHVQDDGFNIDLNRAKEICDLILKRNLKFPWVLFNGIRVDSVDYDFLLKLKKSGCYRIGLGIESGDQNILDLSQKGITIEQIKNAVALIKSARIETFGFFIIGLPGETKESLERTLQFARELNLDVYKFSLAMPYPGTALFKEWDGKGYIKSRNWSNYFFHNDAMGEKVFQHPNLSWRTLHKYYRKAYTKIYLHPSYLMNKFKNGLNKLLDQ